ncbi:MULTISPECIES: deoxyribose-phosphate aldolase [unclassified Corynebacterium]|uniref:deoxyribose-phosphate aldolase n=1 Tax=unclassified Corynebacterium TaxID=2624378 RepID=UPI001EF4402E|nr:deoxyribose-phosphate aldolase [Corynebacterium sp. ACRQK]MCG7262896.1 deoxyribose-phosphate aldolase [Corynebacterium sp. ACRQL]
MTSFDRSKVSREAVAAILDATLLKPEASRDDVAALVREATELGCGAVCVSPSMLPLGSVVPSDSLGSDATLRIATVAGFPSGKHASLVKATEARYAAQLGADEIDVVIDVAAALAKDQNALLAELITVREAVPHPLVLKVIVESALLDEEQLRTAVRACVQAGADYVKTSTGFHPAGGASVEAVSIMADELRKLGKLAPFGMGEEERIAAGLVGIKASGGIRDWDAALAMIEAGATRLGVSAAAKVLGA